MGNFIEENGLSPEGNHTPNQKSNNQVNGLNIGILMSTMERECMGITGQRDSINPVITTSSEQILFQD